MERGGTEGEFSLGDGASFKECEGGGGGAGGGQAAISNIFSGIIKEIRPVDKFEPGSGDVRGLGIKDEHLLVGH